MTTAKPYYLHATTVDPNGRHHYEGPYHFATTVDALAWVRKQTRPVLAVVIYDDNGNIVAQASAEELTS